MITGIVYLVFGVLTLIAHYFLFQKMGMPGWKGLIPIYSTYLLFKELLSTGHFAVYAAAYIISVICNAAVSTGIVTGAAATMILTGITIAASILTVILMIQLLYRLSRSFGHGAGYTFGLLVITPIMMMILGFGESRYEKAFA